MQVADLGNDKWGLCAKFLQAMPTKAWHVAAM